METLELIESLQVDVAEIRMATITVSPRQKTQCQIETIVAAEISIGYLRAMRHVESRREFHYTKQHAEKDRNNNPSHENRRPAQDPAPAIVTRPIGLFSLCYLHIAISANPAPMCGSERTISLIKGDRAVGAAVVDEDELV